jgi:hypothetical protein
MSKAKKRDRESMSGSHAMHSGLPIETFASSEMHTTFAESSVPSVREEIHFGEAQNISDRSHTIDMTEKALWAK